MCRHLSTESPGQSRVNSEPICRQLSQNVLEDSPAIHHSSGLGAQAFCLPQGQWRREQARKMLALPAAANKIDLYVRQSTDGQQWKVYEYLDNDLV